MKFRYSPTDELKKEIFVRTGKTPNSPMYLEISDLDSTPQQRLLFVTLEREMKALNINTYGSVPVGTLEISERTFSVPGAYLGPVSVEITPDLVWAAVDALLEALPEFKQRLAEAQAAFEIEQTRCIEKMAADKAERERLQELVRQERAAKHAAEIEAAQHPVWVDGKAKIDLFDTLFVVAELDKDERWNSWCKEVVSVDPSQSNGYYFRGEFVNESEGTVELDAQNRLFLVAATDGSRKYQTTTYRAVMLKDGVFSRVEGIETDNSTGGWSLRIRDQIAEALARL